MGKPVPHLGQAQKVWVLTGKRSGCIKASNCSSLHVYSWRLFASRAPAETSSSSYAVHELTEGLDCRDGGGHSIRMCSLPPDPSCSEHVSCVSPFFISSLPLVRTQAMQDVAVPLEWTRFFNRVDSWNLPSQVSLLVSLPKHVTLVFILPPPPVGLWLIHNAKYIHSSFRSLQSLNSFNTIHHLRSLLRLKVIS